MGMKLEYQAWIDAFAAERGGRIRYACITATEQMVNAFPELKQVRGFVVPTVDGLKGMPRKDMTLEDRRLVWDLDFGPEQHAWCITPEGEIVDPTRGQYAGWSEIVYEAYNEEKHGPMAKGKCMDCGKLIFPPMNGFCDDVCRQRTEADWEEDRRKWEASKAK